MSARSPIRDVLQAAVDDASIPGAVAVAAGPQGLLFSGAAGWADLRDGTPMREDHVFRIASMTKLATALLAFQLVAEGRLDLDAEVAAYLPGFGDLQVLDGERLRPAVGRATVRSLLSHTSGLGYDTWYPDLDRYLTQTGRPRLGSGRLDALLGMPLVADPHTSFHYGTSMDWLGLILEKITGARIAQLYHERLFRPLGMADTSTWVKDDPRLRARLAAVHVPGPDGWLGTDADYWAPDVTRPDFLPAGHCLYSTASDFLQLQRVALGGGEVDGIRVAPAELVDQFYVDHIGDLDVGIIPTADEAASADVDLRGWKWSLGLLLATESRPGMRSAGSAGWEGGFNTFYWMDRERGVTAALHTASLPFHDPRVLETYERFERAVYETLENQAPGGG